MINKNREYYSKKGKKIYADFLTFASSDTAIAKCTAKHFLQSFKAKTKKYSIAEFGVGNGNFAYQFLDYITKKRADLDISYSLFDFSKQMLKDAQKRLLRFKKLCNLIVFDAERDKLENFKFDFVVMNELISDLKVELHSKNCLPRDRKKREIVLKFLDRLEDNRKIPFNFKACNFLTNIFANLNSNGFIHVFDYGFYHRSDILDCDIDIWNSFICREYGQQITCDVNFPLLTAIMKAQGGICKIEKQRRFIERFIGHNVRVKEKKDGLYYIKSYDNIIEDDDFYHLQIKKP